MIADISLKVVRRSVATLPPHPIMRIAVGETCKYRLVVTYDGPDEDGDGDGDPVDLTGWTIVFSMRDPITDAAVIPRQADHGTAEEDEGGIERLTIASSETQALDAKLYYADFWAYDPDGNHYPLSGPLSIDLRRAAARLSDPVAVLPEQEPLGQGPAGEDGAGAGDLAIGGDISGGDPLGVLFADAAGNVAQDVPSIGVAGGFRYDKDSGYLMLGDGGPGIGEPPLPPSGPFAIDREFDSTLNAFVQLHNRDVDGASDIWLLAGGLSMGVLFGATETNTALPSFYRGGLGFLFDYMLTIGDVSRAYMRFLGNEVEVAVPIVRVGTANGTISSGTFVKSSSVTGRYEQWTTADTDFGAICGVAMEDAVLNGSIRVAELPNQRLQMKTDGVGAAVAGQPAYHSLVLDGRVTPTDTGFRAGTFESADAGGTPNALVTVRR